MFIEQPNPIPHEALEGTNYKMVNGQLRYFTPALNGHSIPAAWVKCDKCGKIAPASKYNGGKYCTTKCAYADRKGARHANYTGGRYINRKGYAWMRHPVTGKKMAEHRYIMEQQLGRSLDRYDIVHHVNGIRSDNRPENLELWTDSHPSGQRKLDAVKREIMELSPKQRKQLREWLLVAGV